MADRNFHTPIPVDIGDYISYDPISGKFTWIKPTAPNVIVGSQAGSLITTTGYWRIYFKGNVFSAHRVAWFLHTGEDPLGLTIEHRDRNRLNNKISNLCLLPKAEQRFNGGALGYSVTNNGTLAALASKDNIDYHLGNFTCPLLARIAYHDKVKELVPHMFIPFVPEGTVIKGSPFAIKGKPTKRLGYYRKKTVLKVEITRSGKRLEVGSFKCPLLARIAYLDNWEPGPQDLFKQAFVPDCEIKPGPYAVLPA